MYKKSYNEINAIDLIGPSFEDLSDEEMQLTDGQGTPLIVLSIISKAVVSGLISGSVTCTVIIIFD